MGIITFLFRKFVSMNRSALYLARRHKVYFLLPILVAVAVIAVFVFYVAPAIITTFIYAGV